MYTYKPKNPKTARMIANGFKIDQEGFKSDRKIPELEVLVKAKILIVEEVDLEELKAKAEKEKAEAEAAKKEAERLEKEAAEAKVKAEKEKKEAEEAAEKVEENKPKRKPKRKQNSTPTE